MKTYRTSAMLTDGWWWLECIDAPGANSQMRSLADVDEHKEAISHITGIPESDIEISLEIRLQDGDDQERLTRYVELANELNKVNKEFTALQLDLTRMLVMQEKLSYRDVGKILKLSHQRIGQLVAQMKH